MLVAALEKNREQFRAEVRQEGRQEGEKRGERKGMSKGLSKGELIGEIRATQKFLKCPVSPIDELVQHSLKALKHLLKELETELAEVN